MTVTVNRRVISLTGRGARGARGAAGSPGANVMAVGLFVALSTISVPGGTTLVHTSGHTNPEKGAAIYVEDTSLDDAAVAAFPNARAKTANGRYFRLSHYQLLGPYEFGCLDSNDGTLRDAGPAMQAMLDYTHAIAINPSDGAGFYKGTAPINWPFAHFHSAATTLAPRASQNWLGAGSGLSGPSAGAGVGTRITFGPNTTFFRLEFPDSNGDTGVTGVIHDAASSFYARGMCFEGTFDQTFAHEGEYHGFVLRAPYWLEDISIKYAQGTGFLAQAGNVAGVGVIGGSVDCSRALRVKVEGCRDGFIVGGTEANILSFSGCWAYKCTRYGVKTNSGVGTVLWDTLHTASNGLISNVGVYTQTSLSGNRYALTEGGNPLNSPSGTTADTADWDFIEAGGAIANLIPAWVATPGLFRSGGDMVGLDSATFYECYSEYGGFSKFSALNSVISGTIGDPYFRGGTRINSSAGGYRIKGHPNAALILQHHSTDGDLIIEDEFGVQHSAIYFDKGNGNYHKARDTGGHVFQTAPYNGASTTRGAITTNGFELPAAHAYYVNGQQVLGARRTGWTAPTGVATRGTFATGSVTTSALAEAVKALIDDLTASGVIGA